jgi:hypothetical protein
VSISRRVMIIARCSLNASGIVTAIWCKQSAEHICKSERRDDWNWFLPHTIQKTSTVTALLDFHHFFTFCMTQLLPLISSGGLSMAFHRKSSSVSASEWLRTWVCKKRPCHSSSD